MGDRTWSKNLEQPWGPPLGGTARSVTRDRSIR
jgi:hypothetical protein